MRSRRTNVPARRRSALRRGFTLIEVLLVLAILGVIAAMVVPNLLGQQRKAMVQTTRTSIKNLENTLRLYAVNHNGEYPTGGQEILQQLTQPQEVDGETEPPLLEEEPKDAWGTLIFYQYPPRHNQTSGKPDIWSAGPNRQDDQGSGDDVNNWETTTSSR